jgi:Tol biopolymer transport system component/predicted Ser/Thr protein kinase
MSPDRPATPGGAARYPADVPLTVPGRAGGARTGNPQLRTAPAAHSDLTDVSAPRVRSHPAAETPRDMRSGEPFRASNTYGRRARFPGFRACQAAALRGTVVSQGEEGGARVDGQRRTGAGGPLRPDDPQRIGSYEILGRIGEGGMGAVYHGRAPDGRQVAIKVVRPEHARDAGFVARFEDEVANAQRVASFCTAQVLDHGSANGRAYMVTEYIDGVSLKDYVKENGELSPGMLQGVAIGVAAALVAIHAAGLIHRDLKPANVMLSFSGPRVIDFGIARALDVASGLTMTGQLVGSPGWMAPERILQQPVTTAVDIFSWGLLVAFAESGANPFGTGDFSVMSARLVHGEPKVGPLSPPLDRLVHAALDKDPRNRPTARELLLTMVGGETSEAAVLSTLTAWQAPVPLMPHGDAPAQGDPAGDRPGLTGPPPGDGVPVAYDGGQGFGRGAAQGFGQGPGAGQAQEAGSGPPPGQGYGPAQAFRQGPGAGQGAGRQAPSGSDAADGPGRTLASGPPAAPERTLSAEEFARERGGYAAPERTVAADGAAGMERTAAAGSQAAYGQGSGDRGTKPLGSSSGAGTSPLESPTTPGRPGTRPPAGTPPYPPGGSASGSGGRGKVLLAGGTAVIVAVAAVAGWVFLKPSHKPPPKKAAVGSGPAPLPADALLVRMDRQSGWPKQCYGSIATLRPGTRVAAKVFNDDDQCDMLPRWSHDRKQIAFTRSLGAVNALWVMNADGSNPRQITNIIDGRLRVAWSPDGKKIAIAAKTPAGREIDVVDLANPQRPLQLTSDGAMKDDPAWCGNRIAFWSKKTGTQQIYTIDATRPNGPWTQVTHADHDVNDPAFSPKCDTMAYTDQPNQNDRHIWLTAADGTGTPRPLTPTDSGNRDMDATFSPNGSWIATGHGPTEHQTIWAIRVDGSGFRQISSGSQGIAHPDWS